MISFPDLWSDLSIISHSSVFQLKRWNKEKGKLQRHVDDGDDLTLFCSTPWEQSKANSWLTFISWKILHCPNEKSIRTLNFKHVLNTHCLLNQGKILTWNLVHCTCCCLTERAHWPKGNQDSKAFCKVL